MDNAMIQLRRIKQTGLEFLSTLDSTDILLIAVGAAVVLLLIGFTLHKSKKIPGEEAVKKTKGEYVLSRRQQKLRERALIADGIAELLLTLSAKGELTLERYRYWHLRFGTQLALKDLLPSSLTPIQVKDAMRKRIGNGVYKPVNIPGPPIKKKRYKNKLDEILQAGTLQAK